MTDMPDLDQNAAGLGHAARHLAVEVVGPFQQRAGTMTGEHLRQHDADRQRKAHPHNAARLTIDGHREGERTLRIRAPLTPVSTAPGKLTIGQQNQRAARTRRLIDRRQGSTHQLEAGRVDAVEVLEIGRDHRKVSDASDSLQAACLP